MNLDMLKHFQYIAKYKNITKAAKHFYISQSTLSRQIMALEEELKVTLFLRDNKKLELTNAGEVFSRECDLLIEHMDMVIKNTLSADKGKSGELRIVSPGNISRILPQSLNILKNRYPDAQLTIEEYNFNDIPSAILYDIYDIGFTFQFAATDPEDVTVEVIGEDDFSIVVSSDLLPDPTMESILKIIGNMPLILPSYAEPPFIKLVLYELEKLVGKKSKDIIYLNTTNSVMLQISLGIGYSIVPTSLTKSKTSNDQISYIPLHNFSAKSNIVMMYKKNNPSSLVPEMIEIIRSLL